MGNSVLDGEILYIKLGLERSGHINVHWLMRRFISQGSPSFLRTE
jgi:hypothetical protein